MIDVLYNKLAAADDVSLLEWKDVNESIFSKHSQFSQFSQSSEHHNIKVIIEEPSQPSIVLVDTSATLPLKTPKSITKKKDNDATIKPLEIIISETTAFNNSTAYVKEALVAMISKEEFAKIFGATKCAEMMSGIVNNRWNKSTALFISFLLDKEISYNDKVIIYNKEKNKGRITIAKNV